MSNENMNGYKIYENGEDHVGLFLKDIKNMLNASWNLENIVSR